MEASIRVFVPIRGRQSHLMIRAADAREVRQGTVISGMTAPCLRYNHDMNKVKIRIPKAELAEFCKRWNISEFALFGSVLRADFRTDSDVDVLVSSAPQARVTLFDMARMQAELEDILKRDVDVVSKRGLENSRNYLRRKQILNSAQVIHQYEAVNINQVWDTVQNKIPPLIEELSKIVPPE